MQNPWLKLPKLAPYILKQDLPAIIEHNKKANPNFVYQGSMFPEPFFGNHRARIVILNLNPGFAEGGDLHAHRWNPTLRKLLKLNLKKKNDGYPFFFLDPRIKGTGGGQWWHQRLRTLIDTFGARKVSKNLLCIEFFPYHSRNFRGGAVVPSQDYNFFLLRKALKRKATIICFRSYKTWCEAVPELKIYKHVYRLNSSQSVYLTPRNCPGGYKQVVKILGKGI